MDFVKNSVCLFLFTGFLIIFSHSSSYAQDMCNLVQLKIEKIRGRVVTKDENPYPFSSTKVELFKVNNSDILISSAITNKDGFFELGNIKRGEYRLIVWATTEKGLTLFKYDVILQVTKYRKNKETNQILYVMLGENCFDSDAKLIDEKSCPESGM